MNALILMHHTWKAFAFWLVQFWLVQVFLEGVFLWESKDSRLEARTKGPGFGNLEFSGSSSMSKNKVAGPSAGNHPASFQATVKI